MNEAILYEATGACIGAFLGFLSGIAIEILWSRRTKESNVKTTLQGLIVEMKENKKRASYNGGIVAFQTIVWESVRSTGQVLQISREKIVFEKLLRIYTGIDMHERAQDRNKSDEKINEIRREILSNINGALPEVEDLLKQKGKWI